MVLCRPRVASCPSCPSLLTDFGFGISDCGLWICPEGCRCYTGVPTVGTLWCVSRRFSRILRDLHAFCGIPTGGGIPSVGGITGGVVRGDFVISRETPERMRTSALPGCGSVKPRPPIDHRRQSAFIGGYWVPDRRAKDSRRIGISFAPTLCPSCKSCISLSPRCCLCRQDAGATTRSPPFLAS